jgi:hypothetical protein
LLFTINVKPSINNINKKSCTVEMQLRELAGTRTQGPYIKSVLLYQLSYQFFTPFLIRECKNKAKTYRSKSFSKSFSDNTILFLKLVCKHPFICPIFANINF